ncbi:MAG: hypothetical protein L0J67_11040 [Halomonas sp.]|nr:hypothetical protein [Halomonas sp.]MDN6315832.1 hypothetical protein [Halomonas sp.]MDN6337154.1 hypothetical protein [Halomonas sp.]
MNEQQIRWDDLQIISAIAETGTLSGAGRQLGAMSVKLVGTCHQAASNR